MNKLLLTIGFTFAGILTPLAQAQIIPLTFDPTQSSVTISIDGIESSSSFSGTATVDIQNLGPPSGNAQITQLDITVDEALNYSFLLGIVSASTSPGDITISLETPGAPAAISGAAFDQLDNVASVDGDINISDTFGFAGGDQTVDLSTLAPPPFDINSINVTQSGDSITLNNSFSITEETDFGAGLVPVVVEVTYVATGVAPAVLLGDVNMDGAVNFSDITEFIFFLINSEFKAEADIDLDGSVSFLDISPFIDLLRAQ